MATPTNPLKRLLAAGAKKGSAWGTAVALGAGDGVLIESDGGMERKQPYIPDKDLDAPFVLDGDLGPVDPVDFAPVFSMRYEPGAMGTLIAQLFGTAGAPEAQFIVSAANNKIDFNEGGAALVGTVPSLTYGGAALATAIAAAMNAAVGKALTYTCTYAQATGKFTIGAGGSFTIMWNTGTNKATDISTLCGYSDTADDTGASNVSDTAVYGVNKHVIQWADSIIGKFSTFACERPSKIYEVASAKPHKLSLSVADGIVKGTIGLRGDTLIHDSAVNGATQVDALTYADRGHRIMFKQLAAKMNAQTGGDVTSETALELKVFGVDIERALDAEIVAGATAIIEPVDGPQPSIKIKLEFPRSNTTNQAFFTTFTGETEQKLLLAFTGDVIATGHTYSLKLYFPRVRVVNYQCPIGDVVPASIELIAEEASAAPTGMTYARPYAELINTRATDYLA